MDNPKLNEIRKEINAIDSQLLPLLVRRMDAAGKVAEIKREAGIPVLDAQREQQILNRVRERGGAYGTALQGVYAAMMEASRALQHDALGGGQALREQVERALHAGQEWLQTPRIACSGVSGAYSDAASRLLFPEGNVVFITNSRMYLRLLLKGRPISALSPLKIPMRAPSTRPLI